MSKFAQSSFFGSILYHSVLHGPLPFSLGGGGGVGGYPGFVSSQVPTSEAAVSADTHAFARLPPGGLRKIWLWGKAGFGWAGPQALGARAPSPLRPGPQAPGLKTLGCYHNSQSADLGGRWMVFQGGALRGSRLRSSISAAKARPTP